MQILLLGSCNISVADLIIFGEGIWNFGLEKPLSAQSLMGYCGNLEYNADSSAKDGGPPYEV